MGETRSAMRRPMPVAMGVMLGHRGGETLAAPVALDAGDARSVDPDEVVGVDLAAPPRRDRGARLRDEDRALGGEMIRGDVARRRLVVVTGQQEIDTGIGDRMQGVPGAADDAAF